MLAKPGKAYVEVVSEPNLTGPERAASADDIPRTYSSMSVSEEH